jgi:hypothetical protein
MSGKMKSKALALGKPSKVEALDSGVPQIEVAL